MVETGKAEGRSIVQMVTDDIYAISKGGLVGRPDERLMQFRVIQRSFC